MRQLAWAELAGGEEGTTAPLYLIVTNCLFQWYCRILMCCGYGASNAPPNQRKGRTVKSPWVLEEKPRQLNTEGIFDAHDDDPTLEWSGIFQQSSRNLNPPREIINAISSPP